MAEGVTFGKESIVLLLNGVECVGESVSWRKSRRGTWM
jgi:hypothetical protein